MKIKPLALVTAMNLGALPPALALSLGQVEVVSHLAQPLRAEIAIPTHRPEELAALQARLADGRALAGADLVHPGFLEALRFRLARRADGSPYIEVTSPTPINEPAFSFLMDVDWGSGRLLREYSVLLDPPPRMADMRPTRRPVARPAPRPVSQQASQAPRATGELVYGPTRRGDTLSEIAYGLRPDRTMSLPQVIVALFRANPEAFDAGNINRLKAGYTLRLRGPEAISAVDRRAARKLIAAHQRGSQGSTRLAQAVTAKPRLKILSAAVADNLAVNRGSGQVANRSRFEALRQEVAATRKAAASLEKENAALAQRMDRLEQRVAETLHANAALLQRPPAAEKFSILRKDDNGQAPVALSGQVAKAGAQPSWSQSLLAALGGVYLISMLSVSLRSQRLQALLARARAAFRR